MTYDRLYKWAQESSWGRLSLEAIQELKYLIQRGEINDPKLVAEYCRFEADAREMFRPVEQPRTEFVPVVPRPRFEHCVIERPYENAADLVVGLNALAADGHEVISVQRGERGRHDGWYFYTIVTRYPA